VAGLIPKPLTSWLFLELAGAYIFFLRFLGCDERQALGWA
jgi:hypothetical protein